ncbi:response regulator [Paenibacillus mucilaginosus]|uniref:response regulator n=1 Tax=Paenibacillus mucilaginosus TaxID=61624 RepID=UPI00240E7DC0|nr:response regulator [Paenibacillus mucilaginosus]WFA20860.1 response regulator [Paenibacillus mucilaginosus]
MQWIKNARLNSKLMLMILIPMLGVLYFSVTAIVDKIADTRTMTGLQQMTGLAVRINDAVHELQKERGLVAGYYGEQGTVDTAAMNRQRADTDRFLAEMRSSLTEAGDKNYGSRFDAYLAKGLGLLDRLAEERSRIDQRTATELEALDYYRELMESLFGSMEAMTHTGTNQEVGNMLSAYINLSKSKYAVSRERTLFNHAFSVNTLSRALEVQANVLRSEQTLYYNVFASFAPAEMEELFRTTVRGEPVTEVDRMVQAALAIGVDKPLNMDPSAWYAASTQKIDLYKEVETRFSEQLLSTLERMKQESMSSLIFMMILNVLIIGLSVLFILAISRMLLQQIRELRRSTELILQGETDVRIEVRSRDEFGELTEAFNQMVESTRDVITQADRISQGDYELTIVPRSDRDRLSYALTEMLESLRDTKAENERQFWLKTELARLTGLAQGVTDLQALVSMLVSEIAFLVEAGQAAFYVRERSRVTAGEVVYVLLGSFAYQERKHLSNRFRPGEGLVGQCALEKKPILLTGVPEDYIRISSGLGEASPRSILVLPVLYQDEVVAVLELATFGGFTDIQRDLLHQLTELLGVMIQSVVGRQRTEELLRESQELAEELQTQQEELRTANEELEEQTRMLKQSEEKLRVQSEELQAINEELEEKTNYLEHQKADIERQNAEIQHSKTELEKKAEELALASRYKSEFLANMSHELRTPLNSLLILAKSLAANDEGNLTEDQIESAKIIHSGGLDLLTLINDILDLSKVEAGKMDIHREEVRLAGMLRHLQNQFGHVAQEKGLVFKLELAPGLPETIVTDSQRAEQILKNLLSNAFKFTSQGSVSVRIYAPGPGTRFFSGALVPEETVALEVRDTGIGIPAGKQRAIFEAFQQADGSTSRQYGGTGLGLTISRELARLLGGEIQLQSREGEGSVFTLFLPAGGSRVQAGGPGAAQEAVRPSEPEAPRSGLTQEPEDVPSPASAEADLPAQPAKVFIPDDREAIRSAEGEKVLLIVEDDPKFAKVLMDLSRRKGFRCLAAGDGFSALQLAKQYVPTAILLDLGLPDMSGLKVLDHLKFHSETRHIPVHIVSGRNESAASLQKGAIGFLPKPVAAEELEGVFARFEDALQERIKQVLVVEDDAGNQKAIQELLRGKNVEIHSVFSGRDALERMKSQTYDCVILDLKLPDMTGFEMLQRLVAEGEKALPPVIINTGKELTQEEYRELGSFTDSIVIKGVNSPERLLDEVSLFLHSVKRALPDERKPSLRPMEETDVSLKGRKILLVDDDLRNTFALSKVLRQHGLNVVMADNGKLALEKLESEDGVELVIMDIMMPVMDGYEAMKRIRANPKHAALPIIALTAKAMAGDREKSIEGGANDYMTKPVDTDKLLSLIRVWLSV